MVEITLTFTLIGPMGAYETVVGLYRVSDAIVERFDGREPTLFAAIDALVTD